MLEIQQHRIHRNAWFSVNLRLNSHMTTPTNNQNKRRKAFDFIFLFLPKLELKGEADLV